MSKKDVFKYLISDFHSRELPGLIERRLKLPETSKTISLIGPRRSGKTFYFYQLIRELEKKLVPKNKIVYINFEDDRILPLKINDLNDLIEAYFELYPENKARQIYFFFDEIQNIPQWEAFIRRIIDQEKAKIFITGSSSKLLSKEIATALRGRTITFQLLPLSFKEFLEFKAIKLEKNFEYSPQRFVIKKLFEEYLLFGGFPEVAIEEPELKQKILKEYFELILQKDIIDRFSIRNTFLLKNLVKYLITNLASIFSINSYHKIASKQSPAAKDTIMEYISYLEDANLIHLIPIFDYSLKKQQANPKKAFCIDNGLRNAVAFTFSKDEGKLAENLAFIEFKRKEKETFYWKNKNEVDFIIKNKNNSLEAINVSYTNEINEREINGLIEFSKTFKKTKKLTIITKDIEKTEKLSGKTIHFIPLWKWLLKE
ncbi:MAG: ATP-binding protein [archaeon]|nr:ATP-binding protein [archaeon]